MPANTNLYATFTSLLIFSSGQIEVILDGSRPAGPWDRDAHLVISLELVLPVLTRTETLFFP